MCVHHKWTRPVLKQNTANATRNFSQEKFRDTATEIMPCPSRWKAVLFLFAVNCICFQLEVKCILFRENSISLHLW